jgi:A/G-specific adenine glycosylase
MTRPTDAFAPALLAWFRANQRDLPWRRTADPYAIWVSEVMLQQTQVQTVLPYYERFMRRFPTLESLAEAPEEDVIREWAGLGYYARARNLRRGAQAVVAEHGGQVPREVAGLLRLPGVGRYTAGAIASIAFNEPAPILDGNVTRVLCRVFGLRGNPKSAPLQGRLWELAEELIPPGAAREFNPAMMELGATVCLPVAPRCDMCPVAGLCVAWREGTQQELPETPPGAPTEAVRAVAGVLWRDGHVLLARRRAGGRWSGMWQFPNGEVGPEESWTEALRRAMRESVGVEVEAGAMVGTFQHTVTRYRVTLRAFHVPRFGGEPAPVGCAECAWVAPEALLEYGLPSAHRRLAETVRRQWSAAPESPFGKEEQLELALDR